MFGLSGKEMRFVLVISASHLGQHFLMRLLPPLIPVLAVVFEYPLWQLGILVSLFSFGSGIAQAPFGILADRMDRLYILPTGIAVVGVGYVLFAAAPLLEPVIPGIVLLGYPFGGDFVTMSVAMLIVGIGLAVVHPVGYPMITDNVAPDHKGKALGAFGSSAKFGDALAPAVVGVMILLLAWDQILLILGIGGIAFGGLLFGILRSEDFETRPSAERNDGDGTGTPMSIRTADRRTYLYPLVIIYLFFISKNFSGEGIKTFVPAFVVGVYAYTFEFSDIVLGAESVANFYFAGLLVAAGILQLGVGGLVDRVDKRMVLLAGLVVAAVGFLALSLLDLGPILLFVVLCLTGVGIYGIAPARDALISDIAPPELEGRTFGYIWTAIMLTGSVMPPIVGYIIETMGMRAGFLVLTSGTIVAAGFVSLLFLERFYVTDPQHGRLQADPSD